MKISVAVRKQLRIIRQRAATALLESTLGGKLVVKSMVAAGAGVSLVTSKAGGFSLSGGDFCGSPRVEEGRMASICVRILHS